MTKKATVADLKTSICEKHSEHLGSMREGGTGRKLEWFDLSVFFINKYRDKATLTFLKAFDQKE